MSTYDAWKTRSPDDERPDDDCEEPVYFGACEVCGGEGVRCTGYGPDDEERCTACGGSGRGEDEPIQAPTKREAFELMDGAWACFPVVLDDYVPF